MRKFSKPELVLSKCLGFEYCRYNGLIISSETVDKLNPFVNVHTVCPEIEIGLGVPRNPVRIVDVGRNLRLMQPASGVDVTEDILLFSKSFLDSIEEVDGFILKSRSPTCGIKDVKVYSSMDKGSSIKKTYGFFGHEVLKKFPNVAVEDEGRLRNFRIREHFLTKLFTLSSFKKLKNSKSVKDLIKFHTHNKFLFMAYNQNELRILGRIVANQKKRPYNEVIVDYEKNLFKVFSRIPRFTSNINVLMHGLGYFSKTLSFKEKAFFLDSMEMYRNGKIPLSVPLNIMKSWIIRFNNEYLMTQTFFMPYPEELMEITDSGKGRDYK
jgi:uncharacterized protein YbgA (DUF1722 family)/uncharacterized protein YbbK (DUF523 family)